MAASGAACRVCERKQKIMKRCTRCRQVYYCCRECQIKDWPSHRTSCVAASSSDTPSVASDGKAREGADGERTLIDGVSVTVRFNKSKLKPTIDRARTGPQIMLDFSRLLSVPPERLKVVSRGKVMTAANVGGHLEPKAVFQAFGEPAETEEGLDSADIDCLIRQLGVERNQAIRALRKTGTLVDAIFYMANR